MKLTSQMPSSTCLMPSFWPAFSRESARERLRHCQAPFPLLGHTTCPLAGTAFRDDQIKVAAVAVFARLRSFDHSINRIEQSILLMWPPSVAEDGRWALIYSRLRYAHIDQQLRHRDRGPGRPLFRLLAGDVDAFDEQL